MPSPSLLSTLGLLGVAVLYGVGWRRLFHAVPRAATAGQLFAFGGGLLVLWAALLSPLGRLDHTLLTAHMAQHLLVLNLAAPLLLLGQPVRAGAALWPAPGGGWAVRVGHALRPFGHLLTTPWVGWLSGTGVVLLWHVPAVFQAALHSPALHAVQHASFLAAGLLFFWPVVLPWPAVGRWARWTTPLYLFLATLPCDALAAFLAFSGRVVYPHYHLRPPGVRLSALEDQACAGALMWFGVTVGYLVPAVLITLQLLSHQPAPLSARR